MYRDPLTPPAPPKEPQPTKLIQVTIGGDLHSMDGAVDHKGQVGDPVLYQFYTEVMGKSHQDVMEYHGYYNTDQPKENNTYIDFDGEEYDEDDDDFEAEPLFVMLTVTLVQLKSFARLFNVSEDSVSVHVDTSTDSGPTRAYIQGTCIKTEEDLEAERQALRAQYEADLAKYERERDAYYARMDRKSKLGLTS